MYSYVTPSYVTRMYSFGTRMLPVYMRTYSYVIGVYPYVLVCYSDVVVCYSYVFVWCLSQDPCQHQAEITQSYTFEALIRLSTNMHNLLTLNTSEI